MPRAVTLVKVLFIPFPSRQKQALRPLPFLLLAVLTAILTPRGMHYIEVISHRYHPIYAVQTDEKVVALTFDISWGSAMAPRVLGVLARERVPATFFLSGPWVASHADLASQIVSGGHEVGSHGHAHVNFSQLSKEQLVDNVQAAHYSIKETLGVEPGLIRTPNGDFSDETILTLRELGYQTIDWMIDSLDWKNPGVGVIIQRVVSRLEPGAIILMHASDSCKLTDLALPSIIQEIRSRGYRFVKVSKLLTMGSTNTRIR